MPCQNYTSAETCLENKKCYVQEQGEKCIKTPVELNWDKEIVVKSRWYDQTLFELFDGKLRVTTGIALGAVISIVIISLIISAVLSYFAYVKRK